MERGAKEIENLKHTCYINSVVQVLAQVPPLKRLMCQDITLEAIDSKLEYQVFRLTREFWTVLNQIWSFENKRIKPKAFVQKCFSLCPYFVPFTQQDSQEFLTI